MKSWVWVRRVLLVIIPPGVFVLSWFVGAIWAWLFAMALFLVFLVFLGMEIAEVWVGALVDPRNRVSLARFQTVLWTILVVSSFLVAAVHNVRYNQPNPLGITIPAELWILLGVSGTALAGAGLIKQEKAKQTPEEDEAKLAIAKATGIEEAQLTLVGKQMQRAIDGTTEVVSFGGARGQRQPEPSPMGGDVPQR